VYVYVFFRGTASLDLKISISSQALQ